MEMVWSKTTERRLVMWKTAVEILLEKVMELKFIWFISDDVKADKST